MPPLAAKDHPAQVHRGAVVLVGDAHGMSPNMAEGASLAFEDTLVLAASLRDAETIREALAAS